MKRCSGCGLEKPLSSFYLSAGRSRSRCKGCYREYNARRGPRGPQNAAYVRRWEKDHPNQAREYNRAAAQRRRQVCAMQTSRDADTLLFVSVLRRDPCCYCGADHEHVDHIEPVSKGGSCCWENLTSSCATCNTVKQNMPLLAFMERRL